jgi:anti-sigma regulatory factor (Ser/Thr protein kinase)
MTDDEAALRLVVPPGPRFAAVGAEFVRGAAAILGVELHRADRLALIAEEVLAASPPGSGPVSLALRDRRHAMRLELGFATADLDLAGLDQARRRDPEDAEGVGLYLAARLADRLTTEAVGAAGVLLGFDLARAYPARVAPPPPPGLGPMQGAPVEPDDATLALLVEWAEASAAGGPAFRIAARVLDQRAAGELAALVALDARRRPLGGLFWQPFGRRLMALSGPALLLPDGAGRAALATALLHAALGLLARGSIQGLVVLEPAPDLPAGAFEVVGHLPDAAGGHHPVLFRALEEDPGGIAWVPDALRGWVSETVRRLGLGRDIEAPPPPARATGAAMAAETDRAAGRVTLRPLLVAADAAAVAMGNVALFRAQGFAQFRAVLDLGQPGHAAFAEGLVQAGLAPAALIPDAAGDLLLLAAPG